MYALAEALAEPGGYDVQPILISVDPERDTPDGDAGLCATPAGFPAGLVGVERVAGPGRCGAAPHFTFIARKAPIEGAPADVYNVDHSSFLYVLDGQWRTRLDRSTMTVRTRRPAERGGRQCIDGAACIAAG